MKVVIFGATGNTGLCCTRAAVKLGYKVTTFVRDPARLPEELSSQVTIKAGDVLDSKAVDEAVENQDAVVILLGTRNDLSPTTMMSDGTKNILAAMKKHGVKRVSACLSAFNFREKAAVPERFYNLLEDHERILEALKASNLEWVAVLPPHITGAPNITIADPGFRTFPKMMKHVETLLYNMAQVQVTGFRRMILATSWCLVCHQMNISTNNAAFVISLSLKCCQF